MNAENACTICGCYAVDRGLCDNCGSESLAQSMYQQQWIVSEVDLHDQWKVWHSAGPSVWLLPKKEGVPAGYAIVGEGLDLLKFRIPDGSHKDGPDDVVEFSLWEKHMWERPAGLRCQFRAEFEDVIAWCDTIKDFLFSVTTRLEPKYRPRVVNNSRVWEVCGCKFMPVRLSTHDEFELADSILYVIAKSLASTGERANLLSKISLGLPKEAYPATWALKR